MKAVQRAYILRTQRLPMQWTMLLEGATGYKARWIRVSYQTSSESRITIMIFIHHPHYLTVIGTIFGDSELKASGKAQEAEGVQMQAASAPDELRK